MSPRILVTISRSWSRWSVVREKLTEIHERHPDAVLVHGDAPQGDRQVAGIWQSLGGAVEPWPAQWGKPCTKSCRHKPKAKRDGSTYCPVPGPVRNAWMVESNPDLVLAFIRNASKGATGTYDLAMGAGLSCLLYEHNDDAEVES